MPLAYFLSFVLMLSLGWAELYWLAKTHFSGIREVKERVQSLKQDLSEQQLKNQLIQEEYLEFRQDVATLMPKTLPVAGQGKAGYPLRTLAAVINANPSDSKVRLVIIKTLFERGQRLFRDKKYSEANQIFAQFVGKYSYSEHTPEAYFLWLDGAFRLGDYQKAAEISQQMVEMFPGTELTGFALLRLGRVYEIQGRAADAVDIYKTVLRFYPQRDLASQAKLSLRGVDL